MKVCFAVVLFTIALAPAADGACDRPEYHRLDFWIGDWNVVSESGEPLGANRVESILKGCAIQENWTELSGEEGKSLFYYSPGQRRWKQVWVTDSATAVGGMKEKRALPVAGEGIRFQGELVDRDRIILDRTTLRPLADGRVRQIIEVSIDGGTTWKVQFDALYEPKRPVRPAAAEAPAATTAGSLSASDTASIRAATLAYRDAWLTNDANRVMATLTSDAVLLPSGLEAIHGSAAIRAFWWPGAATATTTVTAMDLTIDTIEGHGDIAFVRGRGTLTFTTAAASAPRSLASTFINVLRRQPSGTWLIAERMWSDLR